MRGVWGARRAVVCIGKYQFEYNRMGHDGTNATAVTVFAFGYAGALSFLVPHIRRRWHNM